MHHANAATGNAMAPIRALVEALAKRLVLLGDHIKSGLWLPSGGHVEPEGSRRVPERSMGERSGHPNGRLSSVRSAHAVVTKMRILLPEHLDAKDVALRISHG